MSDAPRKIPVHKFVVGGEAHDTVSVELSYGIIKRFSEGLYSSPNKAFEELVTNSYDAGASMVWIALPTDLASPSAHIVVLDNGESMDIGGLRDLWKIGESKKRSEQPPPGRPNPVGKFGIGKLATYVLAKSLTHLVLRNGEYRAVTMDFGVLESDGPDGGLLNGVDLQLDVVTVTRDQAIDAVKLALEQCGRPEDALADFFASEPAHWTAAVLSDLRETAREIELGRLRWILRTALPLNSDFSLLYNGEVLAPSKSDKAPMWTFVSGKDEKSLPKSKEGDPDNWASMTTSELETASGEILPAINLPGLGPVAGTASLYRDPIDAGKSERIGRSNGFFVRVLGRLVNIGLDAADFNLEVELHHGTLSRFHMEVWADGLDEEIASARESVKESPRLTTLKRYLLDVFNRARTQVLEADRGDGLGRLDQKNRLADPPPSLSQGPLRRMLAQAGEGDAAVGDSLGLATSDLVELPALLAANEVLVETLVVEPLGDASRFSAYDPSRRAVILNADHPFVENYATGRRASEPLRLIGLAQLISAAHMLDEGISAEAIRRTVARHDNFLRELVRLYPRSASAIAQNLEDGATNRHKLEDAVADALHLMGFDVDKRGGTGHGTDGIAVALLGRRHKEEESLTYAFNYDAKSAGDEVIELVDDLGGVEPTDTSDPPKKIAADATRSSILRVHREELEVGKDLPVPALFTVVVAPDFQGANDPGTLIHKICENDSIVPISVDTLARLVRQVPLRGLTPVDLRPLFELRSPAAVSDWIGALEESPVASEGPNVAEVVFAIQEMSGSKAAIEVQTLEGYFLSKGVDIGRTKFEGILRGISALAPKTFFYEVGYVALNAAPDALFLEIEKSLAALDLDAAREVAAGLPKPG